MAAALVLATVATVRAHQPTESTATFRADETGAELSVTLSLRIAEELLRRAGTPVEGTLGPANFEAHRTALQECLPRLFSLQLTRTDDETPAARAPTPLALQRAVLGLPRTGEIDVLLEFPAVEPGRIELRADFIAALPVGFHCIVRQEDAHGEPAAWALLVRERPAGAFVFPFSPPPAADVSAAP